MLKTYELMDRHFGWDARPRPASERQIVDYLLERALRAQGIVSLDSICHLDAKRKTAIRRLIDARRAPQGAGAGRARGRGEGRALGAARGPRGRRRRRPRRWCTSCRPSTRSSSSASGCSCSSTTSIASRPICPKEKRVFGYLRPARAGRRRHRRRHRPQDGPREAASCWCRNGPGWAAARTGRTSGRSRRRCTGSSASSCIEHLAESAPQARIGSNPWHVLTNAPLPPTGSLAGRRGCGAAATVGEGISQAGVSPALSRC